MDLWVYSQDKEKLVKCNDIVIRKFIDEDTLYSYQILGYFEKETEFEVLGIYESKERALEVLNDIKRHIAFLNVEMGAGRFGELDFESDIVYEMPEK